MSGCTVAVATVNPAVMSGLAAASGVAVAGAACYMAARQMRKDFVWAMEQYEARLANESALFAERNVAFLDAQNQAQKMALALSEKAKDDPNVAFLLGNLQRLKSRMSGADGPDEPSSPDAGVALLCAEIDELAKQVAQGAASANLAGYDALANRVSQALFERKNSQKAEKQAALREFLNEEIAQLRGEIEAFGASPDEWNAQFEKIEKLGEAQNSAALQSLQILRTRVRDELREKARERAQKAREAAKLRELVGQISANAQAVINQKELAANSVKAQEMLRKLSALVAAKNIELTQIEALSQSACDLFSQTEKALDELAAKQHLESQVAHILGGLGYRVTRAQGESDEQESRMVAVLDSGVGVELQMDGSGHLEGEMVAFSAGSADVEFNAQERVCDLMDEIFDGLRRRNYTVRERKRRNLKVGQERLKVVQTVADSNQNATQHAASAPQAREMSLPS